MFCCTVTNVIQVDGRSVEGCSQDEVVDMLRSSDGEVSVVAKRELPKLPMCMIGLVVHHVG